MDHIILWLCRERVLPPTQSANGAQRPEKPHFLLKYVELVFSAGGSWGFWGEASPPLDGTLP